MRFLGYLDDNMFSKEDLLYASPRMNLVSSKTSFLIRDILGGSPQPAGETFYESQEESVDPGAGLAALRSPWSSSGTPQEACCGGLLLGCVTVPCIGCAASWNAGEFFQPWLVKKKVAGRKQSERQGEGKNNNVHD